MKSRYVSLKKIQLARQKIKKISYPEKARASVNICLLCMSKSNIHCDVHCYYIAPLFDINNFFEYTSISDYACH